MKRSVFSPDAPPSRPRALAGWTRAAILGAVMAVALPAAHANVTVTFDTLPVDLVEHNQYWDTHDGFAVGAFSNAAVVYQHDLVGAVVDGAYATQTCLSLQCPSRGSQYMSILNDGVLDIYRTASNDTFTVQSFSAAFLGPSDPTNPATAGLLRIQGIKADNTSLTQTWQLPGAGANGYSFNNFTTSGAFANTQFTEIFVFGFACNAAGSCSAFTNNKGQFAIDDIVTTAIMPVPEPSSWMMLGAGLLGLAAYARRRAA